MTPEQVFESWAPDGAPWSKWAKPVLFAHLASAAAPAVTTEAVTGEASPSAPRLTGVPAADGSTVIVVDLPGASGVLAGLLLAEVGYRPVPLYNAVPSPRPGGPLSRGSVAVDMAEVLDALRKGAARLEELRLPADAPPAFLLDARRRTGDPAVLRPGAFDNRSVSLPTDFPSSNLLLASGIRRAVVVQPADAQPQADLAHTLKRWQDAGMEVLVFATGTDPTNAPANAATAPTPITIAKPRWYRHLWHGLLARVGLRPNPLGGFGGFLPVPSSG